MGRSRKRRDGVDVDGLLLIDKDQGWTSHDAVGLLRARHKINKVGHGGTLDPMATGLLVLLLGKCTKLSDWVMQGDKTYEGTLLLGVTTNSQDADGEVEETNEVPALTREDIEEAVKAFTGDIEQIPPMVSAIKKDGVALYKLARKGEVVARDPRPVTIHSFEILGIDLPKVSFRVHCTKGTYVRTLAHDLGQALGCGAHLCALRRTHSGRFDVADALPVDAIKSEDLDTIRKHLIFPETLVPTDETEENRQS